MKRIYSVGRPCLSEEKLHITRYSYISALHIQLASKYQANIEGRSSAIPRTSRTKPFSMPQYAKSPHTRMEFVISTGKAFCHNIKNEACLCFYFVKSNLDTAFCPIPIFTTASLFYRGATLEEMTWSLKCAEIYELCGITRGLC